MAQLILKKSENIISKYAEYLDWSKNRKTVIIEHKLEEIITYC